MKDRFSSKCVPVDIFLFPCKICIVEIEVYHLLLLVKQEQRVPLEPTRYKSFIRRKILEIIGIICGCPMHVGIFPVLFMKG